MSQYRYIFLKNFVWFQDICFLIMNLLSTITLGGFNAYATAFGIFSLVLFGLVGLVAGPNLSKFDQDS